MEHLYKCSYCGQEFYDENEVMEHERENHKPCYMLRLTRNLEFVIESYDRDAFKCYDVDIDHIFYNAAYGMCVFEHEGYDEHKLHQALTIMLKAYLKEEIETCAKHIVEDNTTIAKDTKLIVELNELEEKLRKEADNA